jgi:polyisoprenoid-binding protein YceI
MSSSPDTRDALTKLVGSWSLDTARTTIEFRTKAMWILPVKATAKAVDGGGEVDLDGTVRGTLIIDAGSIDTKNKKRDAHLRTADFLEVEKHPTIIFAINGAQPTAAGKVELSGTLTIHGETKPVKFVGDYASTPTGIDLTVETEIDRSEWGVSLAPMGAGLKNQIQVRARFDRRG